MLEFNHNIRFKTDHIMFLCRDRKTENREWSTENWGIVEPENRSSQHDEMKNSRERRTFFCNRRCLRWWPQLKINNALHCLELVAVSLLQSVDEICIEIRDSGRKFRVALSDRWSWRCSDEGLATIRQNMGRPNKSFCQLSFCPAAGAET